MSWSIASPATVAEWPGDPPGCRGEALLAHKARPVVQHGNREVTHARNLRQRQRNMAAAYDQQLRSTALHLDEHAEPLVLEQPMLPPAQHPGRVVDHSCFRLAQSEIAQGCAVQPDHCLPANILPAHDRRQGHRDTILHRLA